MTLEHEAALDKLIVATEKVEKRLDGIELKVMQVYEQHDMFCIWVAPGLLVYISYEEILCNTFQALVNLVKRRLDTMFNFVLQDLHRMGTFVRIVYGIQPWVLVQGL